MSLGGFGPSIKDGVVYGADPEAVFALSAADGNGVSITPDQRMEAQVKWNIPVPS